MAGYDRDKALDTALSQIERAHGKGAIMRLGESHATIQGISTGSLALDIALGGGACRAAASSRSTARSRAARRPWPCTPSRRPRRRRRRGLHRRRARARPRPGPRSSASTWKPAGQPARQRRGGARDRRHADQVQRASTSSSSTRWPPWCRKAEIDGEIGDTSRRFAGPTDEPGTAQDSPATSTSRRRTMIFINQIRQKIGVMFGSPETTSGGKALKFYTSVRLDIRRIGRSRTARKRSAPRSGSRS